MCVMNNFFCELGNFSFKYYCGELSLLWMFVAGSYLPQVHRHFEVELQFFLSRKKVLIWLKFPQLWFNLSFDYWRWRSRGWTVRQLITCDNSNSYNIRSTTHSSPTNYNNLCHSNTLMNHLFPISISIFFCWTFFSFYFFHIFILFAHLAHYFITHFCVWNWYLFTH
jgi:hypothetical protein